jgi:general secretion pathway protein J
MRRARGFTLIELLVALSVMAILAVMSWRGLDGMTRSQAITQVHSDQVLTLQTGLAQWSADLDHMLEVTEIPAIDWDGRALRIVRASTEPGAAGPRIVAWTRREESTGAQWLRWQSPVLRSRLELLQAWERAAQWAQSPGTEDRRLEVAIVPLADWRLFYYRGNAWTNPLSSSDVQAVAGGSTQSKPPDGVRLILELPPGQALSGVLTRDWARPTAGGNKS